MMTYCYYRDFFENKVLPQIGKDAGDCTGFSPWLEVADKQLYDEIVRLWLELNDIWLAAGDRQKFKEACRAWYDANMTAIRSWRTAMCHPDTPKQEAYPRQEALW